MTTMAEVEPEEGYPPDEVKWEYRFEIEGHGSIKYAYSGRVHHVFPSMAPSAWCGWWDPVMYGTGTFQEREKAHRLPLCKKCAKAAEGIRTPLDRIEL